MSSTHRMGISGRREYFGHAGHFICSDRCLFHIHTHVNGYCISTVGDFRPDLSARSTGRQETVGLDRFFETMVFPLDDKGEPASWEGIHHAGYQTREEANRGHEEIVCRYAETSPPQRGTEGKEGNGC